ncbi:MAG: hypothetical protein AAGE65_06985 [Planctomycetota bacterium]
MKAVSQTDGRADESEGEGAEPPAAALLRAGLTQGQADLLLMRHSPPAELCRRVADVVLWIGIEAAAGRMQGITSPVRWVERCLTDGDAKMPKRMRAALDRAAAEERERLRSEAQRRVQEQRREAEEQAPTLTPAEKQAMRQQHERERAARKSKQELAA